MLRSNKASLGAIALALGGLSVLCASDGADRIISASAKAAGKEARKAAKALDGHRAAEAIAAAEQAVSLVPTEAAYRMLLGQSYMQAGRFTSAGQAFADTLQLDGGNGRAALNLALTQIARGDWQAARRVLDLHARHIPTADRGLAMALAGDTTGAVALLTQTARSPEASPKVRQNLALAYALGGQWQVARVIAAADMSPADVDRRLEQWAAFAQPREASDQVASLLGVRPVADGGQPTALALNPPSPLAPAVASVALAQASPAPIAAPVAVAQAGPAPVAAPVQVASLTPVVSAAPSSSVIFAPRQEIVQPISDLLIRRASTSFKSPLKVAPVRVASAKPVTKAVAATGGAWFVQLGAFDNAGVAKDAWGRATRRYAAFKGHQPQGSAFKTSKANFYRLSVGGFGRAAADQACRAYRARGGSCFVRQGAGDQIAQWAKSSGTQLASRASGRARPAA